MLHIILTNQKLMFHLRSFCWLLLDQNSVRVCLRKSTCHKKASLSEADFGNQVTTDSSKTFYVLKILSNIDANVLLHTFHVYDSITNQKHWKLLFQFRIAREQAHFYYNSKHSEHYHYLIMHWNICKNDGCLLWSK